MVTWTPQFHLQETSVLEPAGSLATRSLSHRFTHYARSRFYGLFLESVPAGKLAPYQKVAMRRKMKRMALFTGLMAALALGAFEALNLGLGL